MASDHEHIIWAKTVSMLKCFNILVCVYEKVYKIINYMCKIMVSNFVYTCMKLELLNGHQSFTDKCMFCTSALQLTFMYLSKKRLYKVHRYAKSGRSAALVMHVPQQVSVIFFLFDSKLGFIPSCYTVRI